MNVEQLNNELALVIANTQELYTLALGVTDFEADNNQISNLTATAFRTIKSNTDGDVDPTKIITSFPETKATVIAIIKNLQEGAKGIMQATTEQAERICHNCDKQLIVDVNGIQSGWYCCDDYYCSESCLATGTGYPTFEAWASEHYTDDGDCYWTEWENDAAAFMCPIDPQARLECVGCQ